MTSLAKIGLLKFDFLGLRTLTVIHDALEMIRENRGVEMSPDDIPLDDVARLEPGDEEMERSAVIAGYGAGIVCLLIGAVAIVW